MKIAFKLIQGGSGADVWTYQLAEMLTKRGIRISVETNSHVFQYFPQLLKFKKNLEKADIIHTNTWNGFAFQGNTPMITTEHLVVHDNALDPYKNRFQSIFHKHFLYPYEKKSLQAADTAICVSQYTKNQVLKIFRIKTGCVPNGVNTQFFAPRSFIQNPLIPQAKNKIMLFYAGNMTKRKGVDLFPEIMRRLGNNFILICASGLRNTIWQSQDNIYIIGKLSQEELIDYYSQCDVFLFPTRMEGLSLTVLEAMSCGAPIVSSACSSMPELIIHGKGGYLCPVDDIEQFVDKIRQLADDKTLQKNMGIFNRARVKENFTIEKMADSYIQKYRQLLSS